MKKLSRVFCLLLAALCLFSVVCGKAGRTALAAQEDAGASVAAKTPSFDTEPASLAEWPSGPALQAEAGILMDARTGTVLFGQNADEKLYPASITKLMTALLVLENCSLSEVVTFSHDAVFSIEADSSHISVTDGEQLTVEQCMYALLIKSANEVANGLAEHVAGSMDAFAEMMNARAAQLGCTNTHFVNAHGLHDENHYTTCHDMALIMKELIRNDTFIQISSADRYTIDPTNKNPEARYLVQSHKMLAESEYTYEGAVAGKTGYTPEAGNTLVTYAVRGNTELIAVSMKSNWKHYEDTIAMFDFGFSNFTAYNMADEGHATVNKDDFLSSSQGVFDTTAASLELSDDSWAILPNSISPENLESTLILNTSSGSNVVANITYSYQNAPLGYGTLLLIDNGKKHFDFKEHETAEESVSPVGMEKPSSNGTLFINIWLVAIIAAAILFLILLVVFIRKRKRRRKSIIRVRNARKEIRRRRKRLRGRAKYRDDHLDF